VDSGFYEVIVWGNGQGGGFHSELFTVSGSNGKAWIVDFRHGNYGRVGQVHGFGKFRTGTEVAETG
jgi:hypothetical protein